MLDRLGACPGVQGGPDPSEDMSRAPSKPANVPSKTRTMARRQRERGPGSGAWFFSLALNATHYSLDSVWSRRRH
jgi:hypothetical protein